MRIGYARVSTTGQNTDSQLDDLANASVEAVYVDKISGKKAANRPELQACLKALREGDTLVITRLSRLCRSLSDLLHIVETLSSRGVKLETIHQGGILDYTQDGSLTATSKLVVQIMGAIDEFQREIINENTREGLAAARQRGRIGGGKPKLNSAQVRKLKERRGEGVSVSELSREFKVSRATVNRYLES
jgi:DNA invertase Pin-like site-specific DNA recombinase